MITAAMRDLDNRELLVEPSRVLGAPDSERPVLLYLSGLPSARSRKTALERLRLVARVLGVDSWRDIPWERLDGTDWEGVRRLLVLRGTAPASVNLVLSVVRGVAACAEELCLLDIRDLVRIRSIRMAPLDRRRAVQDAASGREIEALLDACRSDRSPSGVRDLAMAYALYEGGLRQIELVRLSPSDYDPETGVFQVRRPEDDRRQAVELSTTAVAALEDWLELRGDRPGRLFLPVSQRGEVSGEGMAPNGFYKAFIRRCREAGLERVSPEDLRRAHARDFGGMR